MSLEKALKEHLESLFQPFNLFDGLITRIFPVNAPESSPTPYVTYISSPGVGDRTLSGVLSSKEVEFEIHAVADSYSEMKTITSEVIQHLQSFQDRRIGVDQAYLVQEVVVDPPNEIWDNQVSKFRGIIEFTIYV